MEPTKSLRYENLDYLRGLCALSILLYHYVGWTMQGLDISGTLAKLGVYGVSLFYVLSGLTMYLVYFRSFSLDKNFFKEFYVKRFFRIYPLMWLVMLLAIALHGFNGSVLDLLLQFTGLFGFVDWAAPLPVGVWSIGNELCFYALLPLFFYCLKKGKLLLVSTSLITFGIYFYFAFFLFDRSKPISEQDGLYKNPLCQAGLFLGGILIAHIFKDKKIDNKLVLMLLASFILAFVFYPVKGNAINIIAGQERVVYTLICFGIAFCFFKADLTFLFDFLKRTLSALGDTSYSIYLLHAHIWTLITFTDLKIRYVFPIAVISTLIVCWFVYSWFETPFRKLGVRLVNNKK